MTTSTEAPPTWETVPARVGSGQITFARAGQGDPVLVLPRENGHPPSDEFVDALAGHHTVYHPWYPGFHGGGDAADWAWLGNPRDLAVVIGQAAAKFGLERMTVIGLGFGGWLAAEIAATAGGRLSALILVAPMGIRPPEGYILDQFLVSTEGYARAGFADDAAFEAVYGVEPDLAQLESWETDREMTSRLAWKPYMHNRALTGLLRAVETPTLVVWGEADKVVPVGTAALWKAALPNCTVEVIPGTGHAVNLEQPRALASIVAPFLKAHTRL